MRKVIAILFLLSAVGAFADGPDPMLRQLDFFAADYDCVGTAFANPTMPEHATRGHVTAKWGLGGYWIPFTYAEEKSAANASPITVSGYFGYDPATKQFVSGSVDSMGGYSTASSSGWDGDAIVFTGPWHMTSMTTTARDTFRKKGDRQLIHIGELQMDGKWVKYAEETCTRK